ncbi:MAG: glycosyl hydrolase [Bacteroidota bacterium]
MKRILLPLLLILFILPTEVRSQKSKKQQKDLSSYQALNPELFKSLKWRNIGPFRGGRANAIAGVPGEPFTYYAGYTGGGVWKTIDAGENWHNLSDGYFQVGSIGDIAVSPSDPNVVYVGSGEHAVRGVMTSYGDGVYKSTDAGKSWEHMGLSKTRHISDVLIHPQDHNIVYIGAQGPLHGPGEARGVFKSSDGGKSWEKLLYIDENTGISSLVMDPSNPRILYAASWQHRRLPWYVESGGPASSIYKSTDAGETWQKIVVGLPEMMGKIGLSVSAVNPNRVFAIIESEKKVAGLYRSDDAGAHWVLLSNNQTLTARSWYYMEVFADPTNQEVVYVLNAPLMKSIDGGKTFKSMRVIHGDCHDFWINPQNGQNFAMAEDGGATISFSGGKTWSSLNNQPTAQFYRINADKQVPYWVYSGQQDNLSVAIPTRSKSYGILTRDWFNGPGCESAYVTFDDPENPRVLFGTCFNGRISLLDTKTQEAKNIMPYPMTNLGYEAKDMKYRFNWNAPLINSPHDPKVMYYGGNVLFKTENGGIKWEAISPDLTKNNPEHQGQGGGPFTNEGAGGENYNTIYYIAESPHEKGLIYTASDCGLMHITKDGGKNWTDITPPNLPETMIHSIEVSPHDPGTVYFASTRYKFNDLRNYSYKSTDYGKSWVEIGNDIQKDDFFRVIREDKKTPGLLYAGAERGFYISFDGGKHFERLQLNFPVVPITDLIIRDNDLAASTAGRSFWVLDDLSAIQQSKGQFEDVSMKLYEPKPQYRIFNAPPFYLVTEHAYGENPPEGVQLDYYLSDIDERELKLEIFDESGELVRSIAGSQENLPVRMAGGRGNIPLPQTTKLPMKKGLNRFIWDFRTEGLLKVPTFVLDADYRGHRVAPGSYTAKMSYGEETSTAKIIILDPPDLDISPEAWSAQQGLMQEIEDRINEMHRTIGQSMKMNGKIQSIREDIKGKEGLKDLEEAGENLEKKISEWQSKVIELRQSGFQDALNWPAGMNAEFFLIRNSLDTYDPKVPESYRSRFEDLAGEWSKHKNIFEEIMDKDVKAFNELFRSKDLAPLEAPKGEINK